MLKQERHNIIIREIMTHNKVLSADLSELLDVSEDTIRRDLKELAELGQIKKVHGGAMANPHIPAERINAQISSQAERKAIAEKAASMIEDDMVLLMDGDATSLTIIDLIDKNMSLTIFTNSLQVGLKLFSNTNIETIILGGRMSQKYKITSGLDVINALSEVNTDLCFMETASLHEDIGITESDRENAFTKKAMFNASSKVIALCLSKDLGSIQPFKVEGIDKLDAIITEVSPRDSKLLRFNNKGIDLL